MSDGGAKINGLAELMAALDQLPQKLARNVLRGAFRAGAKVMAADAQASVPVRSGLLRDSIRVTTRVKGGRVTGTVRAGSKGGKARKVARHAHLVEFGTAPHVIQAQPGRALAVGVSKVQHPGARPTPFMRPALDNKGTAAARAAAEYVRERLRVKHGIDVPAPLEEGDE